MYLGVLIILIHMTGPVVLSCEVGFCNLNSWPETCGIPADTLCNPNTFCNGYGRCFKDQGSNNVYCNCSDDRTGDTCQYEYTSDLTSCTSDSDCGGRGQCVSGEAGGQASCQCEAGFRGHQCELETRVFLEDDGSCQNNGVYYKQGTSDGCFCACGYIGKYCDRVSVEVIEDVDCGYSFCNGHGKCAIDPVTPEFACDCFYSYTGAYCNDIKTTSAYPTSNSSMSTKATTTSTEQEHVQEDVCSETGSNACRNGGSCLYNLTSQRYQCNCTCEHYGHLCESRRTQRQICEALDFHCFNAGKCVAESCSNVYCVCFSGYTGTHCEQRITITTSSPNVGICSSRNPCKNGGTCQKNVSGKSECLCKCGYFGLLCEYSANLLNGLYKDSCPYVGYYCYNGGYCYYNSSFCGFQCKCLHGYGGPHCEWHATTTLLEQMTTVASNCGKWIGCERFSCGDKHRCQVDECGKPYCEYDSDDYNITKIWVGSVVAFAILMGICLLYMCCRRRRSSNSEDVREIDYGLNPLSDTEPPNDLPSEPDLRVTGTRPVRRVHFEGDSEGIPPQLEPLPDYLPHTDLPSYDEACDEPPTYSEAIKQQP